MLRAHWIRDVLRTGFPGGGGIGLTPGQAADDEGEKNVWLGTDQLYLYNRAGPSEGITLFRRAWA